MMKPICSVLMLCLLAPLSAVAATEPESIIVVCRSKEPAEKTYQIVADLTDEGLKKVTYIEIDMWNPEIAPIRDRGQVWNIDTTYRPTAKYRDFNRYKVRENTPGSDEIQVLMPKKSKVYALAKELAEKRRTNMVQGEFESILRVRDDYGDDTGGQEYLSCGTGWLNF